MNSFLDQAILTFTKRILKVVKVMEVSVTNGLFDLVYPFISFVFGLQIIDAPLIWKDQHEWIQNRIVVLGLFHFTFYEHAGDGLHVFMFLVALVFVAIELFAEEDIPVFS